ncbi:hypothetical protein H8356DRAFT_1061182 [Neocallimastix lanati (nom. inval.)]|uniref:Phospholipase A2 domain-containing protein n=1 Tax=Neocallimastix californiae TaxID=1754190 RepID=A0A1Y1ZIF7_9FUNG|nr:hypothetical protein H8356DRAFT_1061182 [Neocallimastix sp. JGI-2020a]ORY10021.1 hypothetical protein LY90DRAFT_518786 [Neocallimastix californiae]|eukprot:ORY10021.1 hypothetical protein LY90DRAFT_518786 [Neocallimastix californiae]
MYFKSKYINTLFIIFPSVLASINYGSCITNSGLIGICKDVSQCNGSYYTGYCSGTSNIQCCVTGSKSIATNNNKQNIATIKRIITKPTTTKSITNKLLRTTVITSINNTISIPTITNSINNIPPTSNNINNILPTTSSTTIISTTTDSTTSTNSSIIKFLTTTNNCVDPEISVRNQSFLGLTMIKYKKNTTQQNALSRVDGCSIHRNLKSILKALSKSNVDFEPYFTPACNAHDACYGCGTNKTTCDDKFHDNMLAICNKISVSRKDETLTESCKNQASIYYLAVRIFGQNSYNGDHQFVTNNKNKCDYCKNANNLIHTMFLVEGDTIF